MENNEHNCDMHAKNNVCPLQLCMYVRTRGCLFRVCACALRARLQLQLSRKCYHLTPPPPIICCPCISVFHLNLLDTTIRGTC